MIALTAGGTGDEPDLCLVISDESGNELAVQHLDAVDAIELSNHLQAAAVELITFKDILRRSAAI